MLVWQPRIIAAHRAPIAISLPVHSITNRIEGLSMAATLVKASPEFIEAAIRAEYPDVTDQAPVAAILKHMAGLAKKGFTTDEIVEYASEYKTQMEKKYKEGRDSWGNDFDDTARDALRAAGIASGAAKALAPALALKNPPAAAMALLLSEAASTAKGIGEDALDLTPVQDWVKGKRNLFSTYATHELVEECLPVWFEYGQGVS